MCLPFPGVAGVLLLQRDTQTESQDEVGDNNDVIASDKLPFVPAPHPESGTLRWHWLYEAHKHTGFGVKFKYKPEKLHFPFWRSPGFILS